MIFPDYTTVTFLILCFTLWESHGFRFLPTTSPLSRNRSGKLQSATTDPLFVSVATEDVRVNGNGNIEDQYLRFAGIGRLYINSARRDPNASLQAPDHFEIIDRLTASTVMVVGLGGVGSWAAEALCRSGVGNLILVDLDDICISNTNRQLHATSTTVGQMKIDEMKRRLNDINPHCNITLIHDFVSIDNVYDILDHAANLTALLDAMDGTKEKTALLAACVKRRIPVVTCGAAAGRMDPTKIAVDDLTKVNNDRLLATCRKNLRKFHNFARGISHSESKKQRPPQKWNIQAVFSMEVPNAVCNSVDSSKTTSSLRQCDGPLGTACFVTGSYGFVAAGRITDMIANNRLVCPKPQSRND